MRNLLALVFLLLSGCTQASTSTRAVDPHLRPKLLIGPIEKIYEIAFKAAKRAFPDATNIGKAEGWRVLIERDWFWRGDTIITVTVKEVEKYECIVTVQSKVNWHRLNPCPFDVAMDELKYYGKALEQEYAAYRLPKPVEKEVKFLGKSPPDKPSSKSPDKSPGKSLADRLAEIKEARDRGLLTQSEYEAKRSEILKEY